MNINQNYFKIFALPINFNIDKESLYISYIKLHKQLNCNANANLTELIEINRAYEVLNNPLSRAEHIFELNKIANKIDLHEIFNIISNKNFIKVYYDYMENAFMANDLNQAYKYWAICKYMQKNQHNL